MNLIEKELASKEEEEEDDEDSFCGAFPFSLLLPPSNLYIGPYSSFFSLSLYILLLYTISLVHFRRQVVEDAERVTTTAPIRRDAADAAESGGGVVTLTISEAKEKLKARRMKSRKKTQMEQQQSYQQYNKRTDDSQSSSVLT